MSSWKEIAEAYAGSSGTPGSSIHDATATLSRRGNRWRCAVVERFGSNQGYDQIHKRNETEGRGDDAEEAVEACRKDVLAWAEGDEKWRAELATMLRQVIYQAEDYVDPNVVLADVDDADFRDCVNTGWSWQLYGDGHVAATYNSRWQGSRDGVRYVTEPGYVDVDDIDDSDPDRTAEALLVSACENVDPSDDPAWRQTCKGHIVR